jgi:hypothetical protein
VTKVGLVFQIENETEGTFETVCDIQRESQAVLDSIKENYFHGAFEAWKKNYVITVYIHKKTILKEKVAKIE